MYELIETEDHSLTCRDQETGELYHNKAGAYLEALKSYAEPADLQSRILAEQEEFAWLDVCFGMGYNTWVVLQEILRIAPSTRLKRISVVAIELDDRILQTVPHVLRQPCLAELRPLLADQIDNLDKFGSYSFGTNTVQVDLKLLQGDLRIESAKLSESACAGITDLPGSAGFSRHPTRSVADPGSAGVPAGITHTQRAENFDLVFHDAFSPFRVPELWTVQIFANYKKLLLSRSGAVITYSSSGSVRGAFDELGFHVYRTAVVGAKNGGTLASIKSLADSTCLFALNEHVRDKIAGPGGVPYRDLTCGEARDVIRQRRQQEQNERFKTPAI